MQPKRDLQSAPLARLATLLAVPLAAGWLASGSCQTSYCSEEDCNPCVERCKCTVQACSGSAALEHYDVVETVRGDGTLERRYHVLRGPSLERTFGFEPQALGTAADLERLARAMLDYEHDLFGGSARFAHASVEVFSTAGVVLLHPESAPVSAGARSPSGSLGTVCCLFDRRGVLLEIEHVLAAAR